MARLGVDKDEKRVVVVRAGRLERGNVLVGVERHNTVVVVGGGEEGRGVLRRRIDVVQRRVLVEVVKVLGIVGTSIVSGPSVADGIAVEVEHIHLRSKRSARSVELRLIQYNTPIQVKS